MAKVKIYRPAKNAMQSGRANTKRWLLEYEAERPKFIDPLMGWTGSDDTRNQIKLRFETSDEAVAYAQRKGLDYRVEEPKERVVRPKSYAANFSPDRYRTI
ncbi:MAG: ETC complex I subunit [Rhodospirillales bacterium]